MALLVLAGYAAQDGDLESLRELLDRALPALAAEYEPSRHFAAVAESDGTSTMVS